MSIVKHIDLNHDILSNKFLISTPYINLNGIFHQSLIYVVIHNSKGAVGLILNHLMHKVAPNDLFKIFHTNNEPGNDQRNISVHLGGPMESERGLVLHSSDYDKNLLLKLNENMSISSNTEILKDIAAGKGPYRSLLAMGYTGWKQGQLEEELEKNFWIVSKADSNTIFNVSDDLKWQTALNLAGIKSASMFSQYIAK